VGPGSWIDECNAVTDGAMRVTLRFKIAVRTPAVTDNCSAGFDPVTYDAIRVSAVLSGTGTNNVLPDSRSIPPNTH
jgi:hypothetical protein